ncbi:MAG TPA: NnrS family protein [Myxococcales bacterium]|nr:NnrS family protein [Myxococcales bacterium]
MAIQLPPSASGLPHWRTDPYRLLFPLGVMLAWAGVLHWLLLATGVIGEYRSIFHAFAQIEGFMTCFAIGFLFTLIPRRTGTSPPAAWQMAVAMSAPVAIVVLAWFEKYALSQVPWLILMAVMIQFAVSRFRAPGAEPRVPNSFVWVVLAFLMGIGGSILAGVGAALGDEQFWVHDLGRSIILQGMFTGLVLGVGGMLLPVITRGAPPLGGAASSGRARLLHLLAGLAFIGTFLLEALVSVRLGFALRAAIVLSVLLVSAGIWRPPSVPGLHRRFIWLAAWLLPAGYACVAAFPEYPKAGLHVAFIGCFALLALSISTHVVLSHGGAPQLLGQRPWPVALMGALLFAALTFRVLVDADQPHVYRWLGLAAAAFLCATLVWGAFLVRTLRA